MIPLRSAFFVLSAFFIAAAISPVCLGQKLETFPDARFVEGGFNDGDSFLVEFERGGATERHVLRLYYVDTMETTADAKSDRRRLLQQTRYFGLEDPLVALELGRTAALRLEELLAEPFTVQTAFAGLIPDEDNPVDVNNDGIASLQRLPGIGPAIAERIIDHRPFAALEDLADVPGIGPATLDDLCGIVVFGEAERE